MLLICGQLSGETKLLIWGWRKGSERDYSSDLDANGRCIVDTKQFVT